MLMSTTRAADLVHRREFAKTFSVFAAASLVGGKIWTRSVVAAVRPALDGEAGRLILKLSDYPALTADLGAVRLGTSAVGVDALPKGLFYPILVHRAANKTFHILNSACTHEGYVVRTFNKTSNSCVCPKHGSTFAVDGRRISGPARDPLKPYEFQYDGADTLSIVLPDMAFAVEARAAAAAQSRLELEVLGFLNLEYEVFFKPRLDAVWERIAFALTPGGALSQTSFKGNDDYLKVYVENTSGSGLYQVAAKTKLV